jgi:hypothetical protein
MFMVCFSICCVIFIDWLPPGEKFNNGCSFEKIFELFSQGLHSGRGAGSPRPRVDFDNAASHQPAVREIFSRIAISDTLPNLPIALIISPSDFLLFGDLKAKLKVEELESMEELQDMVKELLGEVTSETMRRVYGHWIGRLNQVIHTGRTASQVNDPDIRFTYEE